MNPQIVDLQRLGRIAIHIKAYRHQATENLTEVSLNTYLEEHLSLGDFLFWYVLQLRPAISE